MIFLLLKTLQSSDPSDAKELEGPEVQSLPCGQEEDAATESAEKPTESELASVCV